MWDGIRSGFDTDQPCIFAHTVGEFTFGIILGVLTGGEALASTAVGKAIKSSVVVLDRLDVVSQVVSKTAGCVLKITYKAGKPVFNVLYEGVKVLPKFFEAPVSGKLYSFIIPLPQVNLKGGIEAFKEAIAKGEVKVERVLDKADNIIVDEEGNILNKAITKEGEEIELLEKVDLDVAEAGIFSMKFIEKEIGFVDLIGNLLKNENLSLDDFQYLSQKNVNALTGPEKVKIANIRNAIPHPDTKTLMQKVITKDDIQKYLNGTYDPELGGFVARACDGKHLKTFEDLYHGLRLDYKNTKFHIEDGSCGVIRFKSEKSSTAIIPTGGSYDSWDYPFTATGVTAGKNGRLGVPELNFLKRIQFEEGFEIWEIDNLGVEKLIATYDEITKKFILK